MINTLTSLRFIFAMMVFGAHCYVIDNHFDIHFFKEGFVGVSFFFMLSGFIIAYNYQKKFSENKITKRTFWVARIARIYPLHWLTLLIAVFRKLCNSIGNYRLVQAFPRLTHIDKRLYTKRQLLFFIQQPFVEFML